MAETTGGELAQMLKSIQELGARVDKLEFQNRLSSDWRTFADSERRMLCTDSYVTRQDIHRFRAELDELQSGLRHERSRIDRIRDVLAKVGSLLQGLARDE